MIRLNSLSVKLPAFIFLTITASLALSAYLIDDRLLSYHRQTATALIDDSVTRIKDTLWQAEVELFNEGQWLLQRGSLQATLALVNNFQRTEAYQPFVFNPEKQRAAEQLLSTVQNGTASAIYFFDRNNALISYATQDAGHFEAGFLSYENAKPTLVASSPTGDAPTLDYPQDITPWSPESVLNKRYTFIEDTPFLVKSYRNFDAPDAIGTLVVASRLNPEALNAALSGSIKAYLYHPEQHIYLNGGEPQAVTQKDASTHWQHDENGFWRRITVGSTYTAGLTFMLHYPAEQYRLEQHATRQGVLFAVLITALFVLPMSLWLVRRFVVAPLEQLMHGVQRISHGDKKPMTHTLPNNELGQLGDAVNAMAMQLKRREIRLKRYAREMERMGYIMTHHLQEPSRRIMLFSCQLQDSDTCQGDDRQAADFIHQQSARLSALVDGARRYLELARTTPRITPVDLNQALDAVLAEPALQQRITQLNARIHSEHLPTVMADAAHIKTLLIRLIDNALCYRHPERLPCVSLWSKSDTKRYHIYCQDNGVGIAPEHHSQVFSLFGRLVTHDAQPGIGLGLSMARQIMRQLNGDIVIKESSPEGTTFLLLFPKEVNDEQGT